MVAERTHSQRIIGTIAMMAMAASIGGCAGPAAAPPPSPAAATQAPAGECSVDAKKICETARAAGSLEAPPKTMGYGPSQSGLPSTARVEIPGGPVVQAMCYYDPQRSTLNRADWTASAQLDAKALAYLKSKNLCAGP
jgi:hypothetical protein